MSTLNVLYFSNQEKKKKKVKFCCQELISSNFSYFGFYPLVHFNAWYKLLSSRSCLFVNISNILFKYTQFYTKEIIAY